jgi:hypothetical protein
MLPLLDVEVGLRRSGLTLTQEMFSAKVGRGTPFAEERRNGRD